MNNTARDFFVKHNMDIDKLAYQKASHIWSIEEVDKIVANYGLDEKERMDFISIADIIGYDACGVKPINIFYSFDHFFDRNGDGYHSRSCGLLDIPADSIMQVLNKSFTTEPIVIHSIYGDKNLIHTNGLHRYTVLRAHFLNETFGLEKGSDEYEKVRQKYTIPAKIKRIDLIKTYSNYLLSNHPTLKFSLSSEFDKNWNYTGNLIVIFPNGEKRVLSKEQLVEFTRKVVLSTNNPNFSKLIISGQEYYEKFGEYINTYIPELSIKSKIKDNGGMKI